MMLVRLILFLGFSLLLFTPQSFATYGDEVGVNFVDAFQAAQDVLKEHGIRKVREGKGEVESKWIEDRVVRKSRLLGGAAKRTYLRRYRIKVKVLEVNDASVHIEVTGVFQQKPMGNAPGSPWKRARNHPEDFDLEKVFFHKVLQQMALNRI